MLARKRPGDARLPWSYLNLEFQEAIIPGESALEKQEISASNTHTYHNQAPYTTALAHAPSHLTERATHAHPLHPEALASVPHGIVLVRVRVRAENRPLDQPAWTGNFEFASEWNFRPGPRILAKFPLSGLKRGPWVAL